MGQILLDDPAHASGGSTKLAQQDAGNSAQDESHQTLVKKLKQWAADLNAMATDLYAGTAGAAASPRSLQLSNWRNSLAKVRAGTGRGRLIVLGDSTTAGLGAGTSGTTNAVGAYAKSRTAGLISRLNASGIPCTNNSFIGDQGISTLSPTVTYPNYDPRLTFGANWSFGAGGSVSTVSGQMFQYTTGAANNLTFTPAGQIDSATVYWARSPGNGSFTWNVDGGSSLGTIATAGGASIQSTTATFTKGPHTINLVPDNNGTFYIVGIVSWDSTTPGIDIIQCGWSGALMNALRTSSSPWQALGALVFLAPNLTILQATINDSNAGTAIGDRSTAGTYTFYLNQVVQNALSVGDVIVESGVPSNTAAAINGTLAQYVAACQSVAQALNCPFLDIGGRFVSWAKANALGWMFDNLHPNSLGYQDVGQAEAVCLSTV